MVVIGLPQPHKESYVPDILHTESPSLDLCYGALSIWIILVRSKKYLVQTDGG